MHHLVTAAREFAKSRVTALHGSWGLLEENAKTTPVGFEPTRGDPIGLAGRRLNRSAKVSLSAFILPLEQEHLQSHESKALAGSVGSVELEVNAKGPHVGLEPTEIIG